MGRPEKDEIDRIENKMWCRAVAKVSGLSWYGLNKKYFESGFSKNRDGVLSRPTNWDKYNREGTTPSDSLVKLVTLDYPETRKWLDHPFWDIACAKELDLVEILQWIRMNEPKVSVSAKSSLTINNFPSLVDTLWRRGDLLSLGTLIAFIRLAWHYRDGALYLDAVQAAMHVLIFNLSQTELSLVRDELFTHIKFHFLSMTINYEMNIFEQNADVPSYTQTLHESLKILIDRRIIKDNNSSKAKASFVLWKEDFVKSCVTELHFLKGKDLEEALGRITKELARDRRSGKRDMTFFQIIKLRRFGQARQSNLTREEIKELLDWKLVLTELRSPKKQQS